MELKWEIITDNLANFQRPYTTYILSTALAVSCLFKETAPVALPIAGAVLGGNIAARTVEKVKTTNANADVEKTKITTVNASGPAQ